MGITRINQRHISSVFEWKALEAFWFALLIYLTLVIGGPVAYPDEALPSILARAAVLLGTLTTLVLVGSSRRSFYYASSYFFVCALIFLPRLPGSENVHYAIAKSSDLLFGTILAFLLGSRLLLRHGWNRFYSAMIMSGLLILSLTVLYKAIFGFWSRDVRFFLNGPIVFGWLMGMMTILSILMWERTSRRIFLLVAFPFFFSVVWTASKGPLIACLAILVGRPLLGLIFRRRGRHRALLLLVLVLTSSLLAWIEFGERIYDTRFGATMRFVQGDVQERDEGSVGVRMLMLAETMDAVRERPVSGIGLGNWDSYSSAGFQYPHNQHLEILVELGAIVFIFYVSFLALGLFMGEPDLRWLVIFLLLVGSFSGDIAYLRYPLFFLLLAILVRNRWHVQVIRPWNVPETPRISK